MIIPYVTFIVAIIISSVSAYYSVEGLTAIFSGAFWSIVVMGSALEVGKISTTLLLHKYWSRFEITYKIYLCSAVVALMCLTSIGIFGGLSKAHTEVSAGTKEVAAQLALYDEKIQIQRDNIALAKTAIVQLNAAVDQTLGRSTNENGADKAVAIRRSQAKERARLQDEISVAQAEIVKIQAERSPIASEMNKMEADVGPIKYLANIVYGDNVDSTTLEHAVRWVIILIVSVFDPLALTLLLASTKAFEWESERTHRKNSWNDFFNEQPAEDFPSVKEEPKEKETTSTDGYQTLVIDPLPQTIVSVVKSDSEEDAAKEANRLVNEARDEPEYILENIVAEEEIIEESNNSQVDQLRVATERFVDRESTRVISRDVTRLESPEHSPEDSSVYPDPTALERPGDWVTPEHSEAFIRDIQNLIRPVPDHEPTVTLNTEFPKDCVRGDVVWRIDFKPSRLYKFTGNDWIEMDKSTVTFPYTDEYINYLIDQISNGLYNVEQLSELEKSYISDELHDNQ